MQIFTNESYILLRAENARQAKIIDGLLAMIDDMTAQAHIVARGHYSPGFRDQAAKLLKDRTPIAAIQPPSPVKKRKILSLLSQLT